MRKCKRPRTHIVNDISYDSNNNYYYDDNNDNGDVNGDVNGDGDDSSSNNYNNAKHDMQDRSVNKNSCLV